MKDHMPNSTAKSRPDPSAAAAVDSRPACPICRKAGCFVAGDDPPAVVCRRVTSAEAVGAIGYLHVLREGPAWTPWRLAFLGSQRLSTGDGDMRWHAPAAK